VTFHLHYNPALLNITSTLSNTSGTFTLIGHREDALLEDAPKLASDIVTDAATNELAWIAVTDDYFAIMQWSGLKSTAFASKLCWANQMSAIALDPYYFWEYP
jgi:hypothetical protein